MRKNIIVALTMTLVALASCDKVYINEELDGMWQLQKVERSDTVVYPQGIYYSFQRHLVQVSLHYEEGIPLRYLGNLDYQGDSLTASGFRKFLEEHIAATEKELSTFYIYDTTTTFHIDRLNEEVLIMHSNKAKYTLKKW